MQSPPWSDPWAFLNAATYVGTKSLPDGKLCDAWKNDYGTKTIRPLYSRLKVKLHRDLQLNSLKRRSLIACIIIGFSTATTCWRGNDLMMQIIEGKDMSPVYAYTTDYEGSVDEGVFELPKSCSSNNVGIFTKPIKRAAKEMPGLFPQNML